MMDLYHVEGANNDSIENHSRWVLGSTGNVHMYKDQAMPTTMPKGGDFGYINV